MAEEIESRVTQIPYQHREELLTNLMWLSQTGESTIPSLLRGLQSEDAKVRSSCAWVLGRIHDRRTIPQLQVALRDSNESSRLEVARTLVSMGDLQPSPLLIEGLDNDKKEVRFLCHEALKAATGRDFGYDHLSDNDTQRHAAVLGWRQWWSEFSGDTFFASNYQQRYNVSMPAAPTGEGKNSTTDSTGTKIEVNENNAVNAPNTFESTGNEQGQNPVRSTTGTTGNTTNTTGTTGTTGNTTNTTGTTGTTGNTTNTTGTTGTTGNTTNTTGTTGTTGNTTNTTGTTGTTGNTTNTTGTTGTTGNTTNTTGGTSNPNSTTNGITTSTSNGRQGGN